jgi:uncharacterized membrane protein YeaQ/YmgE (transglycosylase-associated protein family)
MVGMSFESFLTLLVIGVVVASVYHWILRYRIMAGGDAWLGEVMLAWIGGWLGSPVLGHWRVQIGTVYVIPAILGAIVAVHLEVLACKWLAQMSGAGRKGKPEEVRAEKMQPTGIAA